MKIEICDICKDASKVGLVELLLVEMILFRQGEDWLGRPKRQKCICIYCFEKIFPPKTN